MNRDFKGVWIPKEIWLCKDLSALDRVILAEINSLDGENHCTAGNEYLAEFCGVSVATITRSIQKLTDLGYIEPVSFNGRSRVLKMISLPTQIDEADSSNCVAINIDNNTANNTENIPIINNRNTGKLEDDFDSHCYSPAELKADNFLGSAKKKQPKKNLYSQCMDEIYSFTQDVGLIELLKQYLDMRIKMKDKPLRGVNQWKGMLTALSNVISENHGTSYEEVVQQSIERGWASFFPVHSKSTRTAQTVASEYGVVKSNKQTKGVVCDEEY